jgi:hypothetical protein
VDQALSIAVLTYFSVGRKPWPHRDPEAVEADFGDAALDLVPRIKAIEDEVYAQEPDWATISYDEAVRAVGSMVRERQRELVDPAVQAFMTAFAYDWR